MMHYTRWTDPPAVIPAGLIPRRFPFGLKGWRVQCVTPDQDIAQADNMETPSKSTLMFLERLFSAEINGEPARHENNKISREAVADGLADDVYFDIPADKSCPFPMRVIGLALTHRGRIAYCEWAATQHDPEEIGL